ncbi:hypothetical protein AEGHOMDF_4759 [Methylobacterium soli]|nr:hypothetical protein AEGHOMDF_4759 [Methylobacterium soli]
MSGKRLASALAVDSPICGMPSANRKRFSGRVRRAATAASRFLIALSSSSPFFLAFLAGGSPAARRSAESASRRATIAAFKASKSSRNRSAGWRTRPASNSTSI